MFGLSLGIGIFPTHSLDTDPVVLSLHVTEERASCYSFHPIMLTWAGPECLNEFR